MTNTTAEMKYLLQIMRSAEQKRPAFSQTQHAMYDFVVGWATEHTTDQISCSTAYVSRVTVCL